MKAHLAASFVFLVLVFSFLLHAWAKDVKPIALKVAPLICFGPAKLELQVRVHPTADDRWISIATDNGEFRRASDFSIEPDRMFYSFSWTDIPAGEHVIRAAIGHGDVLRAYDLVTVQVMPR